MVLQVGVKIFLKNPKGEYLILKRSKERYPKINKLWDIPGGRIESGFDLIENLKREVREETGLELTKTVCLLGAQDILRDDKHIVRLTYKGEIEGEPELNGDEDVDFCWKTIESLESWDEFDEFSSEYVKKGVLN
ncbi:MAG: hypothetical protein COV91_04470 [Candidatus Taylorbacteria bacterium CG11_big_fil_rev_8_21_14_0_20_46_11]|uniref:Nudix hydrolase domain-containing protein n=1 Tax=Candidatus Taylorbacteria bacterium CG11_big_fil_rev_8_21_14_0_20_46_11 TaxID=1975025 RepID=A0A2H0KAS3_9BACT|nr:MAG: hypothetical protein COV91_04470 [Candidatus Taylorbacteria bacterium CG11_big_fil_rev_8_21_14_0_20_46_11]